jgi:hypothetical protein
MSNIIEMELKHNPQVLISWTTLVEVESQINLKKIILAGICAKKSIQLLPTLFLQAIVRQICVNIDFKYVCNHSLW